MTAPTRQQALFADERFLSSAEREALRRWQELTWTIECRLENGATVSRTYFRKDWKVAAHAVSLPPSLLDPWPQSWGEANVRANA